MSSRTATTAVMALLILCTASVALGEPAPTSTAVYRYKTGPLYFYDTSPVAPAGMTAEGNVFYTFPAGTADTNAFKRFFSATAGHFYSTADEALVGFADDCGGCTIGNIANIQLDGTVPLFRLRHPTDRNYFYTISTDERDTKVTAGWRSEGTAGYVYDTNRTVLIGPTTSAQRAYRSYYQRTPTISRAAGATLEAKVSVASESALRSCNSTMTNQPCRIVVLGDIAINGVQLSFSMSDRWTAIIQIGADRILAGKSTIATNDAQGNPTFDEKLEHTYRIVVPAAVGTTASTTFQLYIDGVLKGTTATNGTFTPAKYALMQSDGYIWTTKDRILFGDSTDAASSEANWKYVRFANTPTASPSEPAWSVNYTPDQGLPDASGWTLTATGSPPSPSLHYTKPAVAPATVSETPIYRFNKGNYLYSTASAGEATDYTLEGNYFTLLPAGTGRVPLHRYKRDDVGYFLTTTNPTDAKNSTGILKNWVHEGSLGWISTTARPGLVPLYRFLLSGGNNNGTHYYTTVEATGYDTIVGYVLAGSASNETQPTTLP